MPWQFLHTFQPSAIAFTLGPLSVHFYGLTMALAMLVGIAVVRRLAQRRGIQPEMVYDLAFWLIIGALAGARLYAVLLFWPYYLANPQEILAVWRGGLAIHGAIIGGALTLWGYCARRREEGGSVGGRFLQRGDFLVVGLAVGQAIGRWGNYFNQELYGRPTDLPWGIPIALDHRAAGYEQFPYFHPTFLYESLLNLALAGILAWLYRGKKLATGGVVGVYLIGYAAIRLLMESLRVDDTAMLAGVRVPVLASLAAAAVGAALLVRSWRKRRLESQPGL